MRGSTESEEVNRPLPEVANKIIKNFVWQHEILMSITVSRRLSALRGHGFLLFLQHIFIKNKLVSFYFNFLWTWNIVVLKSIRFGQ